MCIRDRLNIEIVDLNGTIFYSSIAGNQNRNRLPGELDALVKNNKLEENESVYQLIEKTTKDSEIPRVVYMKALERNSLVVISKSLSGMRDSIAITNRFSLYTGAVIILIGGVLVYLISLNATKPILEINRVAKRISELNFEDKVKVDSQDEIGQLGNSVNVISEELSIRINDLKSDIESRKRLVRDISHELKTPIGVIKGYSEGIQYGVADSEEKVNDYLSMIVNECNRMDFMIKELITHSKYEYSESKPQFESFSINTMFSDIRKQFDQVFKDNNVSFDTSLEEQVDIIADYNLIRRAVTNYLTNAKKYVDGEKKIILSADKNEQNNTVEIAVFNTGQHIPELELKKIWDVFYKVDETRSRSESGSGLGLSIVRQVAKMHQGTAYAENIDEGVKFILKLPLNFT